MMSVLRLLARGLLYLVSVAVTLAIAVVVPLTSLYFAAQNEPDGARLRPHFVARVDLPAGTRLRPDDLSHRVAYLAPKTLPSHSSRLVNRYLVNSARESKVLSAQATTAEVVLAPGEISVSARLKPASALGLRSGMTVVLIREEAAQKADDGQTTEPAKTIRIGWPTSCGGNWPTALLIQTIGKAGSEDKSISVNISIPEEMAEEAAEIALHEWHALVLGPKACSNAASRS